MVANKERKVSKKRGKSKKKNRKKRIILENEADIE